MELRLSAHNSNLNEKSLQGSLIMPSISIINPGNSVKITPKGNSTMVKYGNI